jgi:hypothetical protein
MAKELELIGENFSGIFNLLEAVRKHENVLEDNVPHSNRDSNGVSVERAIEKKKLEDMAEGKKQSK